ncbi:hypothetical protein PRZ48_009676 [Zasmidium cellare]|uniref:Golgi apparatus membrane protein TVP23 n=1 Tax=Zasmidium cellare TaxID=395010 RepID=A0ABR0ECD1_ZASCE|nr:hypothetical protein PRZ48_009676 [Zasmidium cellare]
MADINAPQGSLNWRLSAHPITLITFLSFRAASLLVYLFGMLFTSNYVLIFIITINLLAADFYYLKNIAGRRLVGLRWWNEVNPQNGDSHWVFESAPQPNEPGGKLVNSTDKRFFWLALYAQPALWVGLAILAMVRIDFKWLTLVGEYAFKDMRWARADICSDRIGSYDHQYFGFLQMRQVQPGEWFSRARTLLWLSGQERWRRIGFTDLQPRWLEPYARCNYAGNREPTSAQRLQAVVIPDVLVQLPNEIEDSSTTAHEAHVPQTPGIIDVNYDEGLFLDLITSPAILAGKRGVCSAEHFPTVIW